MSFRTANGLCIHNMYTITQQDDPAAAAAAATIAGLIIL